MPSAGLVRVLKRRIATTQQRVASLLEIAKYKQKGKGGQNPNEHGDREICNVVRIFHKDIEPAYFQLIPHALLLLVLLLFTTQQDLTTHTLGVSYSFLSTKVVRIRLYLYLPIRRNATGSVS